MARQLRLGLVVLATLTGAGGGWIAHDLAGDRTVHVVIDQPKHHKVVSVSVDGPVETCADPHPSAQLLLECVHQP